MWGGGSGKTEKKRKCLFGKIEKKRKCLVGTEKKVRSKSPLDTPIMINGLPLSVIYDI